MSLLEPGTLERLIALKEQEDAANAAAWRKYGVEWANRIATPTQLWHLNILMVTEDDFFEREESADRLVYRILGGELILASVDPRDVDAFWSAALGDSAGMQGNSGFAEAFANGAWDVYREAIAAANGKL